MCSRISIRLILLLLIFTVIGLCKAQFKNDEPDEQTDGETDEDARAMLDNLHDQTDEVSRGIGDEQKDKGDEIKEDKIEDDFMKRATSTVKATSVKLLPNVHVVFRGQRLDGDNKIAFRAKTLPDIEEILHGETIEKRMRVWSIMANVEAVIDKAVTGATRQIDYDVEEDDLYEGDIVLTEEDAKEIEEETAEQIKDGTFLAGPLATSSIRRPTRTNEDDDSASFILDPEDVEEKKNLPIGSALVTNEGNESEPGGIDLSVNDQNSTDSDENIENLNAEESKRLLKELEELNEEYSQYDPQKRDITKRKMKTSKKWSMPIKFSISSKFSSSERSVIRSAISHWQYQTCIRFTESSNLWPPRIRFTKSKKKNFCGSSPVGKKLLVNRIRLHKNCIKLGTISHEIGHSLGFWHEQSRPDRNSYVSIIWKNIKKGKNNFNRKSWKNVYSHGVPYDYSSVMHYGTTAFAKSGTKTIRAKDSKLETVIGQRAGLSFWDAKLVNIHYSCSKHCTTNLKCVHDGYIDPKNCKRCRCPDGWTGTTCSSLRTLSSCGSSYLTGSSSSKYFSSPNYPNPSSKSKFCSWLITCSNNRVVRAWFSGTFSLRYSSRCTVDRVEVRYRDLAITGPRYCGSTRPSATFFSQSNQMLVVYKGSGYKGFKMGYRCVSCSDCTSSSSFVRACVRSYMASCPGRYTIACGFLWLKRCPRYRTNRCLKTKRTCCPGYSLVGSTSCVFTGCGGCQHTHIKSQKPCCRKVSYRQKYHAKCGFLGLKRCTRYRTKYRDVCDKCCSGYRLVGGRCVK